MTQQEIIAIAEAALQTISFETYSVNVWRDERLYINRPLQSKKYQDVGYIRLSDIKFFAVCGNNPRTERDRDAIAALQLVSDALKNAAAENSEVGQSGICYYCHEKIQNLPNNFVPGKGFFCDECI